MNVGAGRSSRDNKQIGATIALAENRPALWMRDTGEVRLQRSYFVRIEVIEDATLVEMQFLRGQSLIQHIAQQVVFCPFDCPVHVFEDLVGGDLFQNAEIFQSRYAFAAVGEHQTQVTAFADKVGLYVQQDTSPGTVNLAYPAQIKNQ
jgi:hypothetical protein